MPYKVYKQISFWLQFENTIIGATTTGLKIVEADGFRKAGGVQLTINCSKSA